MSGQTKVSTGVDLPYRLQAESIKTTVASEPAAPASGKPPAKPARRPQAPPRHPANTYRPGLFSTIFDCMTTPEALKNGISREKLVALVSAILGRDPRLVNYAVIIFCSPESDSPTSHRHRSVHEGFGILKRNGWVKMVLPPQGKPATRSESKAEDFP